MPWIGPDSISALERALRGAGFRSTGSGFATSFLRGGALRDGALRLAFFLLAFFLDAGFFFDAFIAAGFFLLTFFLLAFFLLVGFFFPTLLAAFFLDAGRFLATFFLADFFATGFLRATVFFFDDFFVDAFFLVTFDFLPAGFFLLIGLRLATFFREGLAGFRFVLALFFAGISYSCRFEKNAALYIDDADMEAPKNTFSEELGFHHLIPFPVWNVTLASSRQARNGVGFVDTVFCWRQSFYRINCITLPRSFQASEEPHHNAT